MTKTSDNNWPFLSLRLKVVALLWLTTICLVAFLVFQFSAQREQLNRHQSMAAAEQTNRNREYLDLTVIRQKALADFANSKDVARALDLRDLGRLRSLSKVFGLSGEDLAVFDFEGDSLTDLGSDFHESTAKTMLRDRLPSTTALRPSGVRLLYRVIGDPAAPSGIVGLALPSRAADPANLYPSLTLDYGLVASAMVIVLLFTVFAFLIGGDLKRDAALLTDFVRERPMNASLTDSLSSDLRTIGIELEERAAKINEHVIELERQKKELEQRFEKLSKLVVVDDAAFKLYVEQFNAQKTDIESLLAVADLPTDQEIVTRAFRQFTAVVLAESQLFGLTHIHQNALTLFRYIEALDKRPLQTDDLDEILLMFKRICEEVAANCELRRQVLRRDPEKQVMSQVSDFQVLWMSTLLQRLAFAEIDDFDAVRSLNQLLQELNRAIFSVGWSDLRLFRDSYERAIQSWAKAKGVTTPKLVLEGDHWFFNSSDMHTVNNIVIQLLRNAVTHGIEAPIARSKSGKDPEGRIVISSTAQGDMVELIVKDDGRGIDGLAEGDDSLKKLAIKTVGDGLLLVRQRAADLGGKFSVSTVKDRGSTFKVNFPFQMGRRVSKSTFFCFRSLVESTRQSYERSLARLGCGTSFVDRDAGDAIAYTNKPYLMKGLHSVHVLLSGTLPENSTIQHELTTVSNKLLSKDILTLKIVVNGLDFQQFCKDLLMQPSFHAILQHFVSMQGIYFNLNAETQSFDIGLETPFQEGLFDRPLAILALTQAPELTLFEFKNTLSRQFPRLKLHGIVGRDLADIARIDSLGTIGILDDMSQFTHHDKVLYGVDKVILLSPDIRSSEVGISHRFKEAPLVAEPPLHPTTIDAAFNSIMLKVLASQTATSAERQRLAS